MRKCIAVVPARGGNKKISKKNIKDFLGKPLISYPIDIALKSNIFEKVIVSTDDDEIAEISRMYGAEVPFLRPKELSDDSIGTGRVVNHALEWLENRGEKYDFVCIIYPAATLLNPKYIIEGLEKLQKSDAVNSFSATAIPFSIQRTFKINNGRCQMLWPENFSKRNEDFEEIFQDAGQFYWKNLNKKPSSIMFGEDSIPIVLPRFLVYQDTNNIVLKDYVLLTIEEHKELLGIRNSEYIREISLNNEIIDFDNHINFVKNLNFSEKKFFAIIYKNEIIGGISIFNIKEDMKWGIFFSDDANIIIKSIVPIYFLGYIFENYQKNEILLDVKKENINAISYDKHLGFKVFKEENEIISMKINKQDFKIEKEKPFLKRVMKQLRKYSFEIITN